MNSNLKTILLTILTLSLFVIALVELSGVSKTALFNKYKIGNPPSSPLGPTASKPASNLPKTTIEFESKSHDFGTVKEGEVVEHVYKFKNTGSHPLVISDVIATCGCTIPSFPKEPIAPGNSGEIKVQFNSKNRPGNANKNILVQSNGQEETMTLNFKAVVKP